MKNKKIVKTTAMIFVILLFASMFIGCVEFVVGVVKVGVEVVKVGVVVAEGIAGAAGEIARYQDEKAHAKERAKARTELFSRGGPLPFTNTAEERLTRRSSTLAGGIPFDVSPYLLHGKSFAVTENEIQPYRSILEFIRLENEPVKLAALFEFDAAITFDADNQRYLMNASVAVSNTSKSKAKAQIKTFMRQYIAERFGLEPETIKNFKVQFLKTRKGKSKKINFQFDNVFLQDIEPCYYQFDVEVEYQKKDPQFWVFTAELTPAHFDVFNKVYRSDLQCAEAAAIDVQLLIGEEVRKKGFDTKHYLLDLPDRKTPLPIINFVKAAKYTQ